LCYASLHGPEENRHAPRGPDPSKCHQDRHNGRLGLHSGSYGFCRYRTATATARVPRDYSGVQCDGGNRFGQFFNFRLNGGQTLGSPLNPKALNAVVSCRFTQAGTLAVWAGFLSSGAEYAHLRRPGLLRASQAL